MYFIAPGPRHKGFLCIWRRRSEQGRSLDSLFQSICYILMLFKNICESEFLVIIFEWFDKTVVVPHRQTLNFVPASCFNSLDIASMQASGYI